MILAERNQKKIVITGASSGIGRALATELASHDKTLVLAARSVAGLEQTAKKCRERGAEVVVSSVDLTNEKQLSSWIEQIESDSFIDTIIFNAGLFSGTTPDGKLEENVFAQQVLETNLVSPVLASLTLGKKMIERGSGHLIFISSLAAIMPQSDAPVYSASKAGVTAFGRALREFMQDYGVQVTIVHPGHISTHQAEIHQGDLPFLISAEQAAKYIAKSIEGGRTEIDFPFLPSFWVKLTRFLPWRLQSLLNKPLRFRVDQTKSKDMPEIQVKQDKAK